MSDPTQTKDTGAAIAAGVEQAIAAAAPTIAAVAVASDPKLQAAILAAQALAPAVAQLIEQFNNQQLTEEQLDQKIAQLKKEAQVAHDDWLNSIGKVPV